MSVKHKTKLVLKDLKLWYDHLPEPEMKKEKEKSSKSKSNKILGFKDLSSEAEVEVDSNDIDAKRVQDSKKVEADNGKKS